MPSAVPLNLRNLIFTARDAIALFPVIRSNLHPVHSNQLQPVLLGKLDRLERPSLGELLATDILRLQVQAVEDWLPEQNEEISVRF